MSKPKKSTGSPCIVLPGWNVAITCFLAFFTVCGPKQPTPVPGGPTGAASGTSASATVPCRDTIAIGFYNVENLFDLFYNGNEYPEYRPGALGWNKQTQEIKLNNIASVIAAMSVDLVGLCEVENLTALKDLQKTLKKQGVAYPYSAIADGRSGTAPCLLSKLPISRFNRIAGNGDLRNATRNILEADVGFCGRPLKIFVNHWPSKQHPESQRVAMAGALIERIRALPAGTEYVIIGDFNSDYDQWDKLRTEKLDDTKGRVGINHVLGTIHGDPGRFESYVSEYDLCNGKNRGMHFDPWLEVPERNRWSLQYRGSHQTLDHVLLPATLFDTIGISYCDRSFEPFTWKGKLLRDGVPFRWQMKGYGKRRFHAGEGYADHLPVRARLVRAPFKCQEPDAATMKKSRSGEPAGGFEVSLDGWMPCGSGIALSRDSTEPRNGRYCLRIDGPAALKNGCAGRVVLERRIVNAGRTTAISFAIKGSGKLSIRIRSGIGKWRYYNGPSFTPSNSARYLPVAIPRWKQVSLWFTADMPGSRDLEMELRTGKEAPFRFWVDRVRVEQQ
jgi:endonuclease/exonuclease/phosphatase family metal-dependent hydrolase